MSDIQSNKVSIIIPAYNVEKYLAECLDSAIGQSHQDKEIIIINDGSTDSTAEIISNYQKKHREIIAITTENRGQSSARNTGIEKATGEYIIFLDSDDWLEKETIESCLSALKAHSADIVMFNAHAFADKLPDFELRKFDYTRPQHLTNKKLLCRDFFSEFIKNKNYLVSPCLYMYRASTFDSIRFLPNIIHEDNLFTTQLLINNATATGVCLPCRFFHRRVRPESIMTQKKSMKHVEGYFVVAEELLKNKIATENSRTSQALNLFIQFMISSAITTAHAAFNQKISFALRKRAIRIFLKTNLRHINPKAALICIFPEVIQLKKILKSS